MGCDHTATLVCLPQPLEKIFLVTKYNLYSKSPTHKITNTPSLIWSQIFSLPQLSLQRWGTGVLATSLLESVSALPGLEYSRGRARVVNWGTEKFSRDWNRLMGWICGRWAGQPFKLSFGSLENPITVGLSSEAPLTQGEASPLWPIASSFCSPQTYCNVFSFSPLGSRCPSGKSHWTEADPMFILCYVTHFCPWEICVHLHPWQTLRA